MSRSYSRGRSRSDSRDRGGRGGGKSGLQATVTRINDRGFGFLEVDGEDQDIFFHSNDIVNDIDIRQLRVDDKVTVDLERSKKKPDRFEAVNVRPENESVKDRERTERRYDDRRGGGRDRDDRRGGGRRDRHDDRRGGGRDRYDDRRGGGRDRRDRDRY